jgi:hypothetical protein
MVEYLAIGLPGAQNIEPPPGVPGANLKGAGSGLAYIGTVAGNGITLFLIAAIFLSLCFIVLGGVQWSTSSGDKNKLSAARAKITWAIVGLVLSLSVYLILNLIGYFFGVSLVNIKF